MNNELNAASLEQALAHLKAHTHTRAERLSITPTKLIMVRYPGESADQFGQRVAAARSVVRRWARLRNQTNLRAFAFGFQP